MSDEDVVIDELQAEPIETNSQPVEDLLKAIQDKNYTQAERQFNDIIGDRLQDTLDQAKARIAASLGQEPEEEVVDELDDAEDSLDDDEEISLDDLDLEIDDEEESEVDEDDDEEDLVAPV